MAAIKIIVQYAAEGSNFPTPSQFRRWAKAAINVDTEVAIRIVDEAEGRALNNTYRAKDYATNVLTFPLTEVPHLIGDIIICAPVVAAEALAQNKPLEAHYAHLTVHGVLHLHGYDHEINAEAELMESLETAIITKLGYANPYLIT
ncbi:MAG: rRNA maturation RNase YbeY [Methylotenera sp.]|nr:rRNA maturation RNase YbeY [Methylotenera sp.]MSP99834.1 rRNA maturation RNase YbeY [Methylotenera sp.]